MVWLRKLAVCVVMLASCIGAASSAPPNGWWWNPAESGRGYFIETRDGVTVLGAFLYDSQGRPIWLVSGGASTDPYNYSGTLFSKLKGQTLFGPYVAPGPANIAGAVNVRFSDDERGTITWPDGSTTAIERMIVGTVDDVERPHSGWWWNPAEDGSGYSIEMQGDTLVFVGYAYADDGTPAWYLSAGRMSSATAYRGDLLKFSNGQVIGEPYRAPGAPQVVGTLEIEFKAVDEAILTFTEPAAAIEASVGSAKAGSTPRQLLVQLLVAQQKPLPKSYEGYIHLKQDSTIPGVSTQTIEVRGMFSDVEPLAGATTLAGGATYAPGRDSVIVLTINRTLSGGLPCAGIGSLTVPGSRLITQKLAEVRYWRTGGYTVFFRIAPTDKVPVTTTCTFPGGLTTTNTTLEAVDITYVVGGVATDSYCTDLPDCTFPSLPNAGTSGSFFRNFGPLTTGLQTLSGDFSFRARH